MKCINSLFSHSHIYKHSIFIIFIHSWCQSIHTLCSAACLQHSTSGQLVSFLFLFFVSYFVAPKLSQIFFYIVLVLQSFFYILLFSTSTFCFHTLVIVSYSLVPKLGYFCFHSLDLVFFQFSFPPIYAGNFPYFFLYEIKNILS